MSKFPGLQPNIGKYGIFVILIDTEVAPGDLEGGVVEDAHQHSGRDSLFPGIVPKGLAQRVTADIFVQPHCLRCMADYPVSLVSGQGIS